MVAASGPRLAQIGQSGATEGQVPAWDSLGGFWQPVTLSAGSLGISAVPGGGSEGQVLTWDDGTGTYGWEDKYPAGASEGEVLTWVSGAAQWVTAGGGGEGASAQPWPWQIWDAETAFVSGDAVTHDHALWRARVDNAGVTPSEGAPHTWELVLRDSFGGVSGVGASEGEYLRWISGVAQWVSGPETLPGGAAEGDLLSWVSGDAQWVSAPTAGLQSRQTLTHTTASLADLADEHVDVTLAAGYRILRVTTDCAARVRLYANQGRRVADHDRPASTQPVGNHGCMLDYQSTAADAVDLAPALEGSTTDAGTTVPMVIQNRSGAVTAVTVDLEWVKTE